jgi:hypothetical protein
MISKPVSDGTRNEKNIFGEMAGTGLPPKTRVARFFLVQHTKMGNMAIKYAKCP